MKYMLMFLISFSALAEDQIVRKLKEENLLLQNQINRNNQFITERKNVNSGLLTTNNKMTKKLKRSRKENKGFSNIYLGLESYNWGDEIDQNAPTFSYEMGVEKWSSLFSYGALYLNDFPASGIQTLVNVFKMNLQYNIKTLADRVTLTPFVSYRYFNVSSPDAGTHVSAYESQRELDLIQRIEDESGLSPGVALSYNMNHKWEINFRADLGSTGRVAGLHLGYKL